MNQKKLWLSSALIVGTLFVASSCSDDDNDAYLTIDNALQTKGVSSDLYGGFSSVPVKANGVWTASIPEECDWVAVLTPSGKGDGAVQIFFDENGAGDVRNTTLTITSGDLTSTVPLFQDDSQDGAPLNDAESAELVLAAAHHYIGYGCMLFEFESNPTKSNSSNNMVRPRQAIINGKGVNKYQSMEDAESEIISALESSGLDKERSSSDSIEMKKDSLGITVDITINYASFKFGLKGEYRGYQNRNTKMFNYRTSKFYNCLEATVNYSDAVEYYLEGAAATDTKDSLLIAQKALLSPGFVKAVNRIKSAIGSDTLNTSTATNTKVQSAIKNLIDSYGSGMITEVNVGGAYLLDLQYDSLYVKEHMGLDSATVTVGIASGLFKLDGKVTASYIKESTDILSHSYYNINVMGGESSAVTAVDAAIETLQLSTAAMDTSSATKLTDLNAAGAKWAETLTPSNGVLTDCACVPIWQIVGNLDGPSGDAVYNYLLARYPNSIYFSDAVPASK